MAALSARARLDLDKENRPPRGMAVSEKKKRGSTPGRPKKTGNQFWDIGKVGRKTGITLEDKGIRDEHGLEPVDHIFSSPARKEDDSSYGTMHESSGPDLDMTLASRKTPRLPPPRAGTPKHTNIGSPKRASTGRPNASRLDVEQNGSPTRPRTQQPTNRMIDFGEATAVRTSIESASPFKPRRTLRRSTGVGQEHPLAPLQQDAKPASVTVVELDDDEDEGVEVDGDASLPVEDASLPVPDDAPIMLDDDNFYDAPAHQESVEVEEVQPDAEQQTPTRSPVGRKRGRSVLDDESVVGDGSVVQAAGPSRKKQKGKLPVHADDGAETIDPSLLAPEDNDDAVEGASRDESEAPTQPKAKGKGKKAAKAKTATRERDANRAMLPPSRGSPVKLNDSPSKLRNSRDPSRAGSVGPSSNFQLRATTPFEDAGGRVSRYGRHVVQPLNYWAGEKCIYKNGEVETIVRADEVEKAKKAKAKPRKKAKIRKLDDIAEEDASDAESVQPDEWEEDVGVIAGMVADFDTVTQTGRPDSLVREDLAFAASSIVTRDVAGSEFKYAKIMTLPFFGSGVVELPPEGYKRAKNSRKMQMCFFVHEGKVMVEVGAAGAEESNRFAISKGGVWVVPRGNNYAISNESKTRTARIFFAQGCEVDLAAQADE